MDADVDDFDISVIEADGCAVVSVTGELDLATAPRLRDELVGLAARGTSTVTVNMALLRFIDSTGLSVLISGLKRLRESGGDLTLQSPTPNAMHVLELTGLTKIFAIS